jgi:outer membrane protein assembly factor BamB
LHTLRRSEAAKVMCGLLVVATLSGLQIASAQAADPPPSSSLPPSSAVPTPSTQPPAATTTPSSSPPTSTTAPTTTTPPTTTTSPIAVAAVPASGLPASRPSETAQTFPNDPAQSGWYPNQPLLSPSVVGTSAFGQLFSTAVDGQVYSAPTVVSNTLVAATETNHVYGLDPLTGAIRWERFLGPPVNSSDVGCSDLAPKVGITSTPAVDPATGTAFVVSKTYVSGTSGPATFFADAIDAATGAVKWSVEISGAASNEPTAIFDAKYLLQRPALTVVDGVVYAGFAGFCDTPDYRGWIVGISTSGSVTTKWTSESGQPSDPSPEGGFWHAGGPITSDMSGQMLAVTGNGNVPPVGPVTQPAPGALGQSVIRLAVQPDGSLLATDYFSPANADELNVMDLDIGSSAVELLPSEHFGTTTVPNLAVIASKQGSLFVLDRSFLGGRGQGPSGGDGVVQRIDGIGPMWSTPTFWAADGGYLYQTVAFHGLQAYAYGVDANNVPSFQLAGSSGTVGYGSSSPIVTSDGTTSGSALVWIVAKSASGDQLRAYDAVPVNGALNLRGAWPVGSFAKFNRITVTNGRVYVGTLDGHVLGFGLEGTESLGGVSDGGPAAASWSAGRLDVFVKGVDGQLWHKWFDGGWSGWEALGGVLDGGPAAASWSAGRLDVFVKGVDGQLWHKWFDGGWSGWEPRGDTLSSRPAVTKWAVGRDDVFWQAGSGDLEHQIYAP